MSKPINGSQNNLNSEERELEFVLRDEDEEEHQDEEDDDDDVDDDVDDVRI